MKLNAIIFPLLLLLILTACRDENKAKSFAQMADRIEAHFVADRRTDRFEIEYVSNLKGLHLRGYTTISAAYDSLHSALATGFIVARNDVRLLPDAALLEGKTAGIINVSVANLRSEPGHSQELATQALMGTPIEVLDFQDGWYLVRTPDRYLAWLEPGAFVAMRPEKARAWFGDDLRMYVGPTEALMSDETDGHIVSDLVWGNLVAHADESRAAERRTKIRLPDGNTGYLIGEYLARPVLFGTSFKPEEVLESAKKNAGRPYLWGGTSPKAMDCSGFTKTAYYETGFVIPRDASQQIKAGMEVVLTDDFQHLLPGDLLFFGRFRKDGSEKITHVGFYTGNGRFLHAGADNGRIMEQSLLPEEDDFAEHRLKTLLRARRLAPGTPGVVPMGAAFTDLLR